MITVDLRGRRQPIDSRTHLDRLNDWSGSGSFIQFSRRDPGDISMPTGEKHPYTLTTHVWDGFRRQPPGTKVELTAEEIRPHHDYVPDYAYPKDHIEAFSAMHAPRLPPRVEETISLAEHRRIVEALLAAHAPGPSGVEALSSEAKAEIKEAAEATAVNVDKKLPSLKKDGD